MDTAARWVIELADATDGREVVAAQAQRRVSDLFPAHGLERLMRPFSVPESRR